LCEGLRAPRRAAGKDRAQRRHLGQPVRQRRQPAEPLRNDRAGNLASDRRQDRRLLLRRRHRRHARRRRHGAQGAQPRGSHRACRSNGRRALQLLHDRQAQVRGFLNHRRHRSGPHHQESRGCANRRRLPDTRRGGGALHLRSARARRPLPRRFLRRQHRRRRPARQGAWPGTHHRHHIGRLRHPLSVEAVQSGISPREEASGSALARAHLAGRSAVRANIAAASALMLEAETCMLRTDDTPAPQLPSRWLTSTAWLADHLRDRNLAVVDASSVPPGQQGDAHADYRHGHIPGAVFFDINAISDHSTELPHMLPGPAQFGEAAGALGISETDTIVVYDSAGLYSAARVWWTFRIFGAKNVFLLDGGLPKWKAEERPLEKGDATRPAKKFQAEMNVAAVAMLADVRMALTDDSTQIVDARSAERFSGKAAEPRPGLRSGHIPGSFNVPYTRLLENGRLAARDRIESAFKDAGVDLDKP